MKQLAVLNPENATPEEISKYENREAARIVVFDKQNNVAILHVKKEKYYKLPGGGLEDGESIEEALNRECGEEIGCEVEVVGEIGSILENRKIFGLNQTSYCFVGKLKGEKGDPSFTEEELQNEFEPLWVPYEEAVSLISNNRATDVEGREYIVPRDTIFLKAAMPNL
jgi:8-oxo-dGTP diphosphatase